MVKLFGVIVLAVVVLGLLDSYTGLFASLKAKTATV